MSVSIQFKYSAQRYSPRKGTEEQLLLFVAPAAEIRTWAGVPRKAFDFQHGFQRSLSGERVAEVVDFFREDEKNISPTSIVVGFSNAVEIVPVAAAKSADEHFECVEVRITMPNFDKVSLADLTAMTLEELKLRIAPEELAEIEQDTAAAIAEAVRLQDEDQVDLEVAKSALERDADTIERPERSYLADFYAQLLGYQQNIVPWPDEQQLREILYSQLKPAVLVDGQHRVFGAATIEQDMLFSVCAMTGTSWPENVYQFVVINQKARPIKPAFLSSIIATSLSTDEIASVYGRLRASNIDVARAEMMEIVNTDANSPFRTMINFEVEGAPGYLQFPGMTRLVREFQNIPNSRSVLLPDGDWGEKTGEWLAHFFALWWGVREYFEQADPRLWRRPSPDNPNNLLKIVTLQEIQGLMLDNWADSRVLKLTAPNGTRAAAMAFWEGFPPAFFTDEWRMKGLQTSVGRRLLREAMTETRRNMGRRNWGHRRLGLFSD